MTTDRLISDDLQVFGHDVDALIAWSDQVMLDQHNATDQDVDYAGIAELLIEAVDTVTLPDQFRRAAWIAIKDIDGWWEQGNLAARAELMFCDSCRYCGGSGTIHSVDWVPYGNGETRMDTYDLCDCYYEKYDQLA